MTGLGPTRDVQETEWKWLGAIPVTWDVRPFRHLFRESAEVNGVRPFGPMLSVSGYRGIEVKKYDDENRRRTDEELAPYRIVRRGQLAVNTMWLNYAGLGVSELDGHVSPAYRSYWISSDLSPRYAHHLLRSSLYIDGYTALLNGIRPNSLQMGRNDLMSVPVLVPPKLEQRAIAQFLDRETGEIDAFIQDQEELIRLLQERRAATISHAVTKGLNPNAEFGGLRDKWAGPVLRDWLIVPVRHLAKRITDGAHISPDTEDGRFPFVSTKDVSEAGIDFEHCLRTSPATYDYMVRTGCQPQPGDVLFSKDGTVGRTTVVSEHAPPFVVASSLVIIRAERRLALPEFLNFVLQSQAAQEQVRSYVKGAGLPRLSVENLERVTLSIPPLEEQAQIVKHLENATREISAAIVDARDAIALSRERRAALISAAVTGKIDVRERVGV